MKILADANIPAVEAAFSGFGEVRLKPGRDWQTADVQDQDILLIRSVTRIDEQLLGNSRVRFIGTATSGTDHIDSAVLQARGISFAAAPGANARSVAEYVLAAMLEHLQRQGRTLQSLTVGIIGYGQVGSRLVALLEGLGIRCLVNDPPLQAAGTCQRPLLSLEEVLSADVVTLHVPLTDDGDWPTRRLISADRIDALAEGTLLINSARGGIIDETALLRRLEHQSLTAVLDCWANEPAIAVQLAAASLIATAHIAGYSADGKLRGTQMLYDALSEFVGRDPGWVGDDLLPEPMPCEIEASLDGVNLLLALIRCCYDIRIDDFGLRHSLNLASAGQRSRAFDRLRRDYPLRREFTAQRISGVVDTTQQSVIQALSMQAI